MGTESATGGRDGGALVAAFRNRNLLMAQLSYGAAFTAESLFYTAVGVYAFEQGGIAAVGVIGFLRVLPTALSLPLSGALADRMPRHLLIVRASALRAVSAAGAAGLAAADIHAALVYTLIVVSSMAHRAFRPTHTALLPSLCTHPEELVTSNAIRGMLHGVSALVGPLIAAILLAASSLAVAFAAVAALAAVAAMLMAGLRYEAPSPSHEEARSAPASAFGELLAGFRELRDNRRPALAVFLIGIQYLVEGALSVFVVVLAIDVLDLGNPGVGVLWAAVGLGNVAGAAVVIGLRRSPRLGSFLGVGVILWSAPIVVAGAVASQPVAVVAFAVIGAAAALVNVAASTLVQRLVAYSVLGRVLALSEASWAVFFATGSLVTPLVISGLGVRGAIVASGCILPVIALLSFRVLRAIDSDTAVRNDRIELLRRVTMLRLLPAPTIEQLAQTVAPMKVLAGETVFAAGDPGDAFYVIKSGTVELLDGGHVVKRLGPGESFGEIALLRSVPRTLGARAVDDAEFGVVDGTRFVSSVTGFSLASSQAEAAVHGYLEADAVRAAQRKLRSHEA